MSRMLFDLTDNPPARHVWTVTELNEQLRQALQRRFASVWVSGEITDLARPHSGHIYLTLKDEQGQLRAVLWRSVANRLTFDLQDGMQVLCEGQIDVYPPRGSYQLMVRQVEPRGLGALQLALLQLRERLAGEGLFDADRKRPLPRFPRRIALVTSPTGAAIHDFLEVQRRRWRATNVLVIPTRVQGAEAAPEIVQAIQLAQRVQPTPDCLVVTRGGGSLEDLWCFNDERVVRAVASCRIPVISAIGHEIDVTLCDLAADVRALTPSEAAERISPAMEDVRAELSAIGRLVAQLVHRRLQLARTQVHHLAERSVLCRPEQRLHDLARRVDEWESRLSRALDVRMTATRNELERWSGHVESLSPLAVLARGYSVTRGLHDGVILRSADQVQPGEAIVTRLARGQLVSHVHSTALDELAPEAGGVRAASAPTRKV
jgi:exodeoxyribonuclease VII large subunit